MFVYGLHACFCLYPYGCGLGEETRKDVTGAEAERRQGRLCPEIPAYMCQHYGCVVCEREGERESKCEKGHIRPCCFSKL